MQKRLLVIDDEADIREVAKASLELVGGFKVLTSASGKNGITLAEREQPDAIILDLMMPEMDGRETLVQLKANPDTQGIPVVLLTAKVHGFGPDLARQAGAAGLLLKPFDPMLLSKQVCAILGWETAAAAKQAKIEPESK